MNEYIPKSTKECFELIRDIGRDYDGYEKPKDLKELIDELVHYAKIGLLLEQENNSQKPILYSRAYIDGQLISESVE